jgi:hypothetical protein
MLSPFLENQIRDIHPSRAGRAAGFAIQTRFYDTFGVEITIVL